jgi:hypothetical protein
MASNSAALAALAYKPKQKSDTDVEDVSSGEDTETELVIIPSPKHVTEVRSASVRQNTIEVVNKIGKNIHNLAQVYNGPKSVLFVNDDKLKYHKHYRLDLDLAEDMFLQSGWVLRQIPFGELQGHCVITPIENKTEIDLYIKTQIFYHKLSVGATSSLLFAAFSVFIFRMMA